MRISTHQLFQSGISAIQDATSKLNKTGLQMATGRRILTPADDPGGATQVVYFNAAIKSTEQYQRNADLARPRLEYEEAQLVAVGNLLQRARELVVAGNNDTYNAENRRYMAAEIRKLREDLLGLANSRDANDEYLFAGTRSDTQPFRMGDDGRVIYVGATGPGAVREVDLSTNRRIAIGDTGAHVFMEIPERSGLLNEAVFRPGASLIGVPNVELKSEIADLQGALNHAGKTYRIQFFDEGGNLMYRVLDLDGNALKDDQGKVIGGPFVPNQPMDFAGRRVTLLLPNTTPPTLPAAGDEILSRPLPQISVFQTLDDIAKAFETPVLDEEGRERLSRATSIALRNLDSALERINEVRTSVGIRLSAIEMHSELNDERLVDLNSTLSEVQDLDYAEAISRFELQQVVLKAAQQTYVQTSRLSLFDFL